MPGISIPGVTNKYNTNETVEKLMEIERVPLTREQNALKSYQAQQTAWRDMNRKLTEFRDSVKMLYSFENPFNNKLASSSNENAITADAARGADFQSFQIEVVQEAAADRFLSKELPSDYQVPKGAYTFRVADKTISFQWKGGSLSDFSKAINKRGGGIVKSLVINSGNDKRTILIESLKTGEKNRLTFENDAKQFALDSGMIGKAKSVASNFGASQSDFHAPPSDANASEQTGMQRITNAGIRVENGTISIPPRNGFELALPNNENHISFEMTKNDVADITTSINQKDSRPIMPDAGEAFYEDVVVKNNLSDTKISDNPRYQKAPLTPISTDDIVFIKMKDGSEKAIPLPAPNADGKILIDIDPKQYPDAESLIVRNKNTGTSLTISNLASYNAKASNGFEPTNPASVAQDAIVKYEGITIKRETNDIDDVVPEITLHVHGKTERPATVKINPDVKSSKDALIAFVGKYNEAIAEINILSQTKPEIIDELSYLSEDERKTKKERLGLFSGDFSLISMKNNMQNIESSRYRFQEDASVSSLAEIGISTNASGGYNGYSPSRLRGYLEINENTLDTALESSLTDIKNMFGYDTDGDLIIDSGIAYRLDQELEAYVKTGGIISIKTSTLDSKIKTSESKIARLETQMDKKEAQLKQQFANMEGSLNSLENQQNTINNFMKQQNRNDN